MINSLKFVIVFLIFFITSCAATVPIEIKDVDFKSDIILPQRIDPVMLENYETINLFIEKKLICFDKENSDIFNRNYFNLLNYIKALESENEYFRSEIEKQQKKEKPQ